MEQVVESFRNFFIANKERCSTNYLSVSAATFKTDEEFDEFYLNNYTKVIVLRDGQHLFNRSPETCRWSLSDVEYNCNYAILLTDKRTGRTFRIEPADFASMMRDPANVYQCLSDIVPKHAELPRFVKNFALEDKLSSAEKNEIKSANKTAYDELSFRRVTMVYSSQKVLTEAHIDFGSTQWFYMLSGEKWWAISPYTQLNRAYFQAYEQQKNKDFEQCPNIENLALVQLRKGDLLLLPAGSIHTVYTEELTEAASGAYFSLLELSKTIQCDNDLRYTIRDHPKYLSSFHIYAKYTPGLLQNFFRGNRKTLTIAFEIQNYLRSLASSKIQLEPSVIEKIENLQRIINNVIFKACRTSNNEDAVAEREMLTEITHHGSSAETSRVETVAYTKVAKPKRYLCNEYSSSGRCKYVVSQIDRLKEHMAKVHLGCALPLVCAQCDTHFATASNIQRHYNVQHSSEEFIGRKAYVWRVKFLLKNAQTNQQVQVGF